MTVQRNLIKPAPATHKPLAVGIVRCAKDIAHVERAIKHGMLTSDMDAVEFRLDCLDADELKKIETMLGSGFPVPTIMTARHPVEGGKNRLLFDTNKRTALLRRFLPLASAIDIEVKFMSEIEKAMKLAQSRGILIIGSLHELKTTPDPSQVVHTLEVAVHNKLDVFKFACQMSGHAHDIETLLFVLRSCQASDIVPSVMGMGDQTGRSSRPFLASLGSWLNYGYIAKPANDWEWEVGSLRKAIQLTMIPAKTT